MRDVCIARLCVHASSLPPDKKNGAPFPSFFFCRGFEGRLRLYVGHGLPDTCTFWTSTRFLHVVNFGGFEWLYLVQYRSDKHQT